MATSGEFYAPFKGRFVPSDDMAEIGSAEKPVRTITATTFVGTLIGNIQGGSDTAFQAHGFCRLQVDSTSQISLQRYQGATVPLNINGSWTTGEIPEAGITLSNATLTAGTLYYIYVFSDGGTLTLEASATGHTADTTAGIQIKTGDVTRTLVGAIYADTGTPGTYVDSTAKRFCINWFNRRDLHLLGMFSAQRSTASTAAVVEVNTEIRMQFITWPDESVLHGGSGNVKQDTIGQAAQTGIGVDGVTVVNSTGTTYGAANWQPWALFGASSLTEGFHYITLLGRVSGGQAFWAEADNIGIGIVASRIWAKIRG